MHHPTRHTKSLADRRARVRAELDASAATGIVQLSGTCCVERDPATTPDHCDEARWAEQRPARRIARGGAL